MMPLKNPTKHSQFLFVAASVLLASGALAVADTVRIEASGSADCRGDVTQAEAIARARDEARLTAIRKVCGTVVQSNTTSILSVRNDQSQSLLMSEARLVDEGLVIEERWNLTQSKTLQDPSTHTDYLRYTVTGDFEVVRKPEPDNSLSVDVSLNRKQLLAGQDALTISLSSPEAVYAMVVNLAADEKVYPIYPNTQNPEPLRLKPKVQVTLPREADSFVLKPWPAPGHRRDLERIRVIVSRQPLALPAATGDGAVSLPTFFRWQHERLRKLDWTQAEAVYEVRVPESGP